jgi:hypothetical protein
MSIARRNIIEKKINDHLWEFIWRRKNNKNLWEGFINALKNIRYNK